MEPDHIHRRPSIMSRSRTLPIPREHGAYVVLAACWLFGIFTADEVAPLPAALSLVAALAAFMLSEPARLIVHSLRSGRDAPRRRFWSIWTAALGAIAVGAGAPLVALRPDVAWALPLALVLSVVYLWLTSRRASMTDLSIVGFLGLSMVAPVARMAAGDWTIAGLGAIWTYTALFFCASAWCVRVRLVGSEGLPLAAAAHTALLALTLILAARGVLPVIALVAIAPAIVRFLWVALDVARYRQQTLKRIGLLETAIALMLVVASAWF
jgi:hypothetical protein